MKKFIPLFSITIASVFMQNCTHRDEEINVRDDRSDQIEKTMMMMKGDSAKTSEEIVDPDPPVRDGDNWRLVPNN
ncbi:hypothetical protein [Chryseobacterium viscerum]|uniref:Uncharacterized protein n=1 Tax=Chryseobacterium viscerum TaxID=1037377 RepID=A0A316WCQ6_9FLAO|nr:hypothetical protein [Chryseobacterium viscerum]PWN58113.1 hypothetical protein C1634_024375 [Chryseobacterium viscerum]